MGQLLDMYVEVTKRTDDGHCAMEAETYLQFVQYVAHMFPVETNEETTWTDNHMNSYLMVRTESSDFIEVKDFVLHGLVNRGYVLESITMHADGKGLDHEVVLDILATKPIQKTKKKKGLLGLIKHFMNTRSAIGEVVPDEYDEELWEEEEEDE